MPNKTPLTSQEKNDIRNTIIFMNEQKKKMGASDEYAIPDKYFNEFIEEFVNASIRDSDLTAADMVNLVLKNKGKIGRDAMSIAYGLLLANIIKGKLHLKYGWVSGAQKSPNFNNN